MRASWGLAALFFAASMLCLSGACIAGVNEGARVFESKKCSSCHQVKGPAGEKTIADQLKKKAPELWYAGSKFRKEFLLKWLSDPKPIRPMKYYSLTEKNPGNHPILASAEASDVTEYLMSLKSPAVFSGPGIVAQDNPKGRITFIKKQSCYGCHLVRERGNIAGGLTGPSLIGAGGRLNVDWIYAYLANPRVFKPIKDMPDYAGILTDAEMRDLAAFIASFN